MNDLSFTRKTQSVAMPHDDLGAALSRLNQIDVEVSRHERDAKITSADSKVTVTVRQVADRYTFNLGYNSASLVGIFVTLLTVGKIRVDFSSYSERLALANIASRMGHVEAVDLYNAYLASLDHQPAPQAQNVTQKLMVQAPKVKK